jgi:hypothetical protein
MVRPTETLETKCGPVFVLVTEADALAIRNDELYENPELGRRTER